MATPREGQLLGLLVVLVICGCSVADISDFRLCGDPECKEVVSKGRTVINYRSNDKQVLSFPINAEVLIYSKEAGSRPDLWGVEIKGKRGYVPKQYIREDKVLTAKLKFTVPTGSLNHGSEPKSEGSDKSLSLDDQGTDSEAADAKETNDEDEYMTGDLALSAEDVEYNRVNIPLTKKHKDKKDKKKRDPDISLNSKSGQESPNVNRNEDEANFEEGDEVHEGLEIDYEYDDEEELEDEEKEEEGSLQLDSVDDGLMQEAFEDIKEQGNVKYPDDQENLSSESDDKQYRENVPEESVTPPIPDLQKDPTKTRAESELSKDSVEEVPETPADSGNLEIVHENANSKTETEMSDVNTDNLETSSEDYEVIDGTTIYYDEVVVTSIPQTEEEHTPSVFTVSSVVDEEVTVHPSQVHSYSSYTTAEYRDGITTESNLESSEKVSDSASIEMPIEPPESQVPEVKLESSIQSDDVLPSTQTSSYWSTASSSLSSLFGSKENESEEETLQGTAGTEEKTEESLLIPSSTLDNSDEEFGEPKEESIIKEVPANKEVESGGFFSSWFGSSEAASIEEESDPESEMHDTVELDEPLRKENEVEIDSGSETSSSTPDSEADPVHSSANYVSSDTIHFPVDETNPPEAIAVQPSTADDIVDNASNTQHIIPPSVEAFTPEPAASPSPETFPETVPTHPAVDDLIDQDDNVTGDDPEEPGLSTARPMYAEPQPESNGYPADTIVDQDDMAYLAAGDGEEASVEGDQVQKDDTPSDSLAEELLRTSHSLLPEGLAFGMEAEVADPHVSSGTLVFLLIVVCTIVVIYFVHLIMVKLSREGPLLEALNRTDRENRLQAEENESLHAELIKTRSQLESVASRINVSNGDMDQLSSELQLVKSEHANEKLQLEERIVQLEHELEEATSNGLEMHKMLSEMLSSQKDTTAFQASVDHLQEMLDGQREKVETLNSDLAMKNRLNEELHNELSASLERCSKLDYQVQQLTQSLEELTGVKGETIKKLQEEAALVDELRKVNESLSDQATDSNSKVTSLNNELTSLRETIQHLRESVETKESELQVAKECLKQLRLTSDDDQATPDEEKLSALFDVIRVKAELQKVTTERLDLSEQLQDAEMAQKNLEDAMTSIRAEVSELRTNHDLAVQEKQEALSRLAVLTQYFEEKEAQLTKELESQEGMRVDAEGSAAAVAKKIQNYELELASYKTQVESMRKELEEQEQSFKMQKASHEQKAHENWLQARAAERKHEEQRQENSQLRNRITLMQKEKEVQHLQTAIIKPTPKRVDANGTMSSPGPMDDMLDGNHSGPPPLHREVDSPPVPPHPLHGPRPMLPMMFPPGGPIPPGVMPPPPGLPPGVPPPPGMPRGVPPPHNLPFLPGEPPFLGPLPPLPGDRRLPPAGGMSSPPFRRSGSPIYDHHRNDRYSPVSDRSHFSDRRYSPPPVRRRPHSPDVHRNRSPDRRSDLTRSPDRRSDRIRRSPDSRLAQRSPDRRLDRRSPERHFTRSPDGYMRHRSPPRNFYDDNDYNSDDSRLRSSLVKGKKTSTPLGPNDR